jgi:hypothetical protein
MHRAESEAFITPLNQDGTLATVKLDQRRICGLRYHPPKYKHVYEKKTKRELYVSDEVKQAERWKAKLDDDTVVEVNEEIVKQFGTRFVTECQTLGIRKFVPIPVGSCRSSAMEMIPSLRCADAPPVHYMQGDIDRCVFSSLASAFHQTGITDLVRVSSILQDKSNSLSGGTECINDAMRIVEKNVKWLQPRKMPKNFEWKNDINNYMFVVGVIKDSTGSCQHAVTIFRNWVYNSNEPICFSSQKRKS